MVKQRFIFVCGACSHYWSAVATGENAHALDVGAEQVKASKPNCPQCGQKPPRWRFERAGAILSGGSKS